MAIALTLQQYLDNEGIDYQILHHSYSTDSMRTAEAACIPGDKLAKCVILEDDIGYLMAVLPATRQLQLGLLHRQLNRNLGLATEAELGNLFDDCEFGAVPPVGEAYGLRAVVDDSLYDCNDVYFEAGNHIDLVHVSGEDFQTIMADAEHGTFTRRD